MITAAIRESLQRLRLKRALHDIRRHGFWFVDIPRTGSSSLKAELGSHFGNAYGKNHPFDQRHRQSNAIPDHLTASRMRQLVGADAWRSLFSFSFVRNPWDRQVSLYQMRRHLGALPAGQDFKSYVMQFDAPRYGQPLALHSAPTYYYSACDYLLDADGNLLVSHVARFEQRAQALELLAERLELDSLGSLHLQRTDDSDARVHYSDYYDNESRELIARVFSDDIQRFDYRFETG